MLFLLNLQYIKLKKWQKLFNLNCNVLVLNKKKIMQKKKKNKIYIIITNY